MLPTFKRTALGASAVAVGWMSAISSAFALSLGSVPTALGGSDVETTVVTIITAILNFMALLAVVVIVIAGIRLVASQGDETAVDKAKKTILFAIIGLVVILLANAIVSIVANIAT